MTYYKGGKSNFFLSNPKPFEVCRVGFGVFFHDAAASSVLAVCNIDTT